MRPDDNEAPVGGYCAVICNDTAILTNPTKNNYCQKMKKSLYQLDCFLSHAHRESMSEKSQGESGIESTTFGVKQSFTEEYNGKRHQLLDSNEEECTSNIPVGIVEAWTTFCRNEDSENLILPPSLSSVPECDQSNTNNIGLDNLLDEKNKQTATAARLGQYFASDQNAQDVSILILSFTTSYFTVLY